MNDSKQRMIKMDSGSVLSRKNRIGIGWQTSPRQFPNRETNTFDTPRGLQGFYTIYITSAPRRGGSKVISALGETSK